jgi:hypothetical protein
MKSPRIALLIAFSTGLVCGIWLIATKQTELMAQVPADGTRQLLIIAAEAELEYTKAKFEYVTKMNAEVGLIYPPSVVKRLEHNQIIYETYLAEMKKAKPEFQNVVIQIANADVELAKYNRDRESRKRKRELLEVAVRAAEKRLDVVKATRDDAELRDWMRRHLILEVMDLRLDFEHSQ